MGKGPVKARSLSITTIIIIVGSSCRRRAVWEERGHRTGCHRDLEAAARRCEVTARQPRERGAALSRPERDGGSVKGKNKFRRERDAPSLKSHIHLREKKNVKKKKKKPRVASLGERNQTSHSLPAQPENDGARGGFASGRMQD